MIRGGLVAALAVVPVLLAQEPAAPLQFNVPYVCDNGHTIIISRCTPAGRGEFCFYEEIRGDGISLGEGYGTRPNIELRVKPCKLQKKATPAAKPSAPLNPPYLSEMPTADRVKQEMKGTDAMDTAARQAAAFFQLREIIYTLALSQRRDRNSVTPDEKRLVDGYYADTFYAMEPYEKSLSATPEGKQKLNALRGLQTDDRIRAEVLRLFFSPAFNSMYAQTDAIFAARHAEFLKAQADATKAEDDRAAADAKKGAEEQRVAKCIASGRNPMTCTGDSLGHALTELIGGIAPALAQPLPRGLRLNGRYHTASLNIDFVHDAAVLSCGPLVPQSHAYTVRQQGTGAVVTIENQPAPITFTYASETKAIAGPVSADVTGKVQIGTRTLTRYDSMGLGTPVSTEPVYEPRTVRCALGSLSSSGPARAIDLGDLPLLGQIAGQMSGVREFPAVAGLRMNGLYESPTGFSVEFSGDHSVMVACRAAVVAESYTVELRGAVATITVQHGASPLSLVLRPDGTLAGTGTADVAGRVITGRDDGGNLKFAPRTDRCTIGTLAPAKSR